MDRREQCINDGNICHSNVSINHDRDNESLRTVIEVLEAVSYHSFDI